MCLDILELLRAQCLCAVRPLKACADGLFSRVKWLLERLFFFGTSFEEVASHPGLNLVILDQWEVHVKAFVTPTNVFSVLAGSGGLTNAGR